MTTNRPVYPTATNRPVYPTERALYLTIFAFLRYFEPGEVRAAWAETVCPGYWRLHVLASCAVAQELAGELNWVLPMALRLEVVQHDRAPWEPS